jgi:hypothetical protein
MAGNILTSFLDFPADGAVIGRLIAGYGELEFGLCQMVGAVLKDDDQAIRVLFRTRGEEQRIEIADALVRGAFLTAGLEDFYAETLGAVRHCKDIRNQYAHSHWHTGQVEMPDGIQKCLWFAALDESAKTRFGTLNLQFVPILSETLRAQEEWFWYTNRLQDHVVACFQAAQSSTPRPKAPPRADRPPLDSSRMSKAGRLA